MRALPIFVAAAAYWLLGAVWYSALFGRVWSAGLTAQGVALAMPSKGQLATKLVLSFVANIAAAAALAMLFSNLAPATLAHAVEIGLIAGVGVAATAIGSSHLWEGKRPSVYLVDAGYHVVGLLAAAAILARWPR